MSLSGSPSMKSPSANRQPSFLKEIEMQRMMKAYPLFIAMGVMIVVAAVIVGAINAGNANAYYAVDKVTRETDLVWANVRAGVESTVIWLPYFKFLGLAMILAGITMALGVIATKLLQLGKEVNASVPERARVHIPAKPRSAMLMRMFLMLGMMVIISGFIVALFTAGTAASLYGNPVVEIDAAATGSARLQDLASVHRAESWLEAFKFIGVAALFLGIISGLSTIIFALQYQKKAIPEVVHKLPAAAVPALASGD
jgi:hypothetical protein